MIASLSGLFQARLDESLILDVSGVGYLIYLPPIVWQALGELQVDQKLHFKIIYQATAQQPRPTLFGFLSDTEKEFFELLASVPRMGGRNAARAMILPVNVLATAIQEGNRELLDRLPGVSSTGAEKMIASLRRKVARFADAPSDQPVGGHPDSRDELRSDAVDLLVVMDVRRPEASRVVDQILSEDGELATVQDIVTEFFRRSQVTRR